MLHFGERRAGRQGDEIRVSPQLAQQEVVGGDEEIGLGHNRAGHMQGIERFNAQRHQRASPVQNRPGFADADLGQIPPKQDRGGTLGEGVLAVFKIQQVRLHQPHFFLTDPLL